MQIHLEPHERVNLYSKLRVSHWGLVCDKSKCRALGCLELVVTCEISNISTNLLC